MSKSPFNNRGFVRPQTPNEKVTAAIVQSQQILSNQTGRSDEATQVAIQAALQQAAVSFNASEIVRLETEAKAGGPGSLERFMYLPEANRQKLLQENPNIMAGMIADYGSAGVPAEIKQYLTPEQLTQIANKGIADKYMFTAGPLPNLSEGEWAELNDAPEEVRLPAMQRVIADFVWYKWGQEKHQFAFVWPENVVILTKSTFNEILKWLNIPVVKIQSGGVPPRYQDAAYTTPTTVTGSLQGEETLIPAGTAPVGKASSVFGFSAPVYAQHYEYPTYLGADWNKTINMMVDSLGIRERIKEKHPSVDLKLIALDSQGQAPAKLNNIGSQVIIYEWLVLDVETYNYPKIPKTGVIEQIAAKVLITVIVGFFAGAVVGKIVGALSSKLGVASGVLTKGATEKLTGEVMGQFGNITTPKPSDIILPSITGIDFGDASAAAPIDTAKIENPTMDLRDAVADLEQKNNYYLAYGLAIAIVGLLVLKFIGKK